MNKRISLGAAISFMLIVAAAVFSVTIIYSQRTFNERVNNLKQREVAYEKYTEIDRLVRDNYIGAINETQLMDSIAQGYIAGIGDKYARYITAEENAKLTEQTADGENVGIGVVLRANPDGYLLVTEVYPDSPAQVAGMLAGDLVVKIDDTDLTIDNVESMTTAIWGRQGTTITLVVRRGGEEFTMDSMPRRSVVVPTVYAHILEGTDIGYIHIKEFSSNTSDQFNRELDRMIREGANNLIFDLRDNKGGVMRQATRIIDRLIPAGIIYTAMRKDGTEEQVTSDGNQIDLPMAVLTNANTASAAELFAQVLKDYNKARTVGTVTAGKGVMQDVISLTDGSAIDITVAYYKPPTSPNYDGVGVVPDYDVTLEEDWTVLNTDPEYDTQLKKAIEVVIAMEKAQENQAEQLVDENSDTQSTEEKGSESAAS
ncbi:MAG: PDZ domain-containing protein [Oscillospiraceae bacterium]|jgi:carboxyl-terminal processing protease|nr:PDZ domain-containing protein [Oscillospiraceae bacterium]